MFPLSMAEETSSVETLICQRKLYNERLMLCVLGGVLLFGAAASGFGATDAAGTRPAGNKEKLAESYGKLPLSFEPNVGQINGGQINGGQTDGRVQFLSRGPGYGIFLTPGEAVLAFNKSKNGGKNKDEATGQSVLAMKLVGANTSAPTEAEDKLAGTANYMRGSDPAKWATKVPTYGKVKYSGVYPGVDLVFYGNQRQLEYDFVVAPGRDAGKIALEFAGATPKVDADGNLALGDGGAKFQKPVVYQMRGGERVPVAGAYEVRGQRVRFRLGKYDHSKELVIDPVVTYLTYLGGSGSDQISGVTVDSSGAAYVTGTTTSTDFPLVNAYESTIPSGKTSMFVSKLNQSGTSLVYSTYLASDGNTFGQGIAVDSSGSAYVGGLTDTGGFPATSGAFQTMCGAAHNAQGNRIDGCGTAGGSSGILAKLSADGTSLVYATYLGGDNANEIDAVAVDSAGEAYVTGSTGSYCGPAPYSAGGYESFECFPTTTGSPVSATSTSNQGTLSVFFTKFDAAGASLVYSGILGPSSTAQNQDAIGYAVAIDTNGLGYITGLGGNAFYTTAGSLQSQGAVNGNSAFVAKFDPSQQKLIYSTYLGGQNAPYDVGYGIAADANGNAYIAGQTHDCDFPTTTGAFEAEARYAPTDTANVGKCDTGFVAKLNTTGSALVWATYLGDAPLASDNTAYMTALALGPDGSVYVAGSVQGPGYPSVNPVLPQQNLTSVSTVTHLSADGSSALFSSTVGGPSQVTDGASGVAVDATGAIYLVGNTLDPNLPTTNNVIQAGFGGGNGTSFDGFIAKIGPGTQPQPSNGLTTNLLANPGAELGSLADWTIGGSGTPQVDSGTFDPGINPHTGSYDFVGGSSSGTDSLSQTVSIIQQSITAAQVDGGTLFAKVSFWEQGLNQGSPSDEGSVTLTFLNASNGTISTVTTSTVDSHDGTWANVTGTFAIPVGTRSITYAMNFIKNQLTDNDAFIDDNSLSIVTDTGLTIFPGRLHFGNVGVGSQSASQTVSVTNQQTTTINISQIVSELGANPSDFIETDNCPAALTAGASCTLTITFVPDGVGPKSAGIAINTDNVPPLQQIAVDGTGTGGILQVNPGNLKAIAGSGTAGDSGDGGPALLAQLKQPNGVAFDPSGNLYIADDQANVVRKVDTAGNITTFAGVGTGGFSGDGGVATQAELSIPFSVASDKNGNIYIQDTGNYVIRKVAAATGIITTFAGTPGTPGHAGDGGPATAARFNQNQGARFDSAGNFYVPQCQGASIRKIDTAGNISTVAGNFTEGFSGDGGQATAAELQCPSGVTIDTAGNLYIADEFNSVIRKVNTQGIISTIAGTPGVAGFSGDGGQATSATFNQPNDVVIDAAGNLYVADSGNNRVRKIDVNGVITTAAGGLNNAGSAAVNTPLAVTVDTAGNVYFSDSGNSKIEEIFPQGTQPFPATQVGSTSASQTLTLSNIGNTDVTLATDGAFNLNGDSGDFALTPGSCAGGAVLTAGGGSCSLSITFAPTAVGQRTLTVGISDNALNTPQSFSIGGTGTAAGGTQVTPTLTWETPAAITTATALSGTQLNATATDATGATLPGTFVYTPAAGTTLFAGTQTLSVTFTPTDTTDYTTAMATVQIVVTQAVPAGNATGISLMVTSGGTAVTTVASGAVVTLTATVMANQSSVSPGQVAFCDATATLCKDSALLGMAQLIGGDTSSTASYKFVPGIGAHSYQAVFLGTLTAVGSSSSTANLTVTGKYPTTTAIAQTGSQGNYTLTATTVGISPPATQATAPGVTINLGQSAQTYVLTGTGASSNQGNTYGNYYNTQGSCVTSGSTTTCDLTGDFTGSTTTFAAGTYDFQTVFTGSVTSAVLSQTQYPVGTADPNDFQYSGLAPSTIMTLKLNVTGGGTYAIPIIGNQQFSPNLLGLNFDFTSVSCGGTSLGSLPCHQDNVGTVAGATYSGPVTGSVAFQLSSPPAAGPAGPTGKISFQDTSNANAVLGTAALGTSTQGLAFQQVLTATTINYPGPRGAVGDFNGDGIADVAFANSAPYPGDTTDPNTVTIALGNGDGTFTTVAAHPATGTSPSAIAAGDFNGDGKLDLAITNQTSNTVTVLLGKGDGTFTAAASPAAGTGPDGIVAGDFNGDGIEDLVVSTTNNAVVILLGKGDGTFTSSTLTLNGYLCAMAVGDFNNDGKLDIAIQKAQPTSELEILLGNGDGTFTVGTPIAEGTGSNLNEVAAGDVNGDGTEDLVIANQADNTVTVLLSNGDGTFNAIVAASATAAGPEDVQVGDFNDDGLADIAVTTEAGLLVLPGNGDGTFTAAPVATGSSVYSDIVMGDFNGDGIPDIVSTDATTNIVVALTQLTQTATATVQNIAPAAAGTHQVVANYSGDTNYGTSVSGATPLIGVAATPVLTWATPGSIVYGTALSATQLDATATTVAGAAGVAIPGTFVYTPALGTVLATGTQTLSVAFTPTDLTTFTTATKTVQIVVTQAVPVITWTPTVASLLYGTALSASQLDAVAATAAGVSIPGTFVYTPTLGTVLAAGTHTLSVTFTPTSTNYSVAIATTPITVTQFSPVLTWATPAPITTATPLSATQLDAAATDINGVTVPGTYFYTPDIGSLLTAGSQTLTVTFDPTDAVDFTSVSTSRTIMVTQATATNATTTSLTITSGGETVTTVASGSVVTLTATVAAGQSSVSPGMVAFCDATATSCTDIHLLGTAQLIGGDTSSSATYRFVPGIGSHSYKAVFLGTTSEGTTMDSGSASSAVPLTVTGTYPTATTIAQSGTAGSYTLTATTVGTSPLAAGPTGSVSFVDTSNANAVLGMATLGDATTALGFNSSATLNTGASGGIPLVGDFNGDGKLDLVVANSFSSGLTLFAGNGDGTFGDGTSTATTGSPHVLAVGDFNGDGFTDIAVSLENFDSTAAVITVLLGSGNGTFTTSTSSISGLNATAMLAGDFNGDGVLDLAVVDSTTQAVTVLLGNGDATFHASGSSIAAPSTNASLATGDFNGDGKLDLVVTSYIAGEVAILLGQGDGTFVAASSLDAELNGPIAVVTGDFNGDGKADLAIADSGGNTVSIFLGKGDGTFVTGTTPAATQPASLSIGDFNGDGKVDLAVGNQSGGSLTVLLGNGDGTFTQGGLPTASDSSSLVAAGDFNGDGASDIAVSGGTTSGLLLSAQTETAIATATGISASGPGTHQVTANYPGDANFGKSVSTATALIGSASALTPTIASITPTETAVSAVNLPLTIVGTNFVATSVAVANGAALTTTYVSATKLTASVPATDLAAAGTVTISVQTPVTGATALSSGTLALQVVPDLVLSSISPTTVPLNSPAVTLTVTGQNFTATTVVEFGGTGAVTTPLVTTFVSATQLTAVLPATLLTTAENASITTFDAASGSVSTAATFTILGTANVTFTGPSTVAPGGQPPIVFQIAQAYTLPVDGVVTLVFTPDTGLPNDPTVLLGNGMTTQSFTLPAGSTATPPILLQAGTTAGTITVSLALTSDGVPVTAVAPIVIDVPRAAPVITSATVVRGLTSVTVTIRGLSSTRELTLGGFTFTPTAGSTFTQPEFSLPVTPIFVAWYTQPTSDSYGTAFTYTQTFDLDGSATMVESVAVTLANSVGVSESVTAK